MALIGAKGCAAASAGSQSSSTVARHTPRQRSPRPPDPPVGRLLLKLGIIETSHPGRRPLHPLCRRERPHPLTHWGAGPTPPPFSPPSPSPGVHWHRQPLFPPIPPSSSFPSSSSSPSILAPFGGLSKRPFISCASHALDRQPSRPSRSPPRCRTVPPTRCAHDTEHGLAVRRVLRCGPGDRAHRRGQSRPGDCSRLRGRRRLSRRAPDRERALASQPRGHRRPRGLHDHLERRGARAVRRRHPRRQGAHLLFARGSAARPGPSRAAPGCSLWAILSLA